MAKFNVFSMLYVYVKKYGGCGILILLAGGIGNWLPVCKAQEAVCFPG
jgi:hypothetical protein